MDELLIEVSIFVLFRQTRLSINFVKIFMKNFDRLGKIVRFLLSHRLFSIVFLDPNEISDSFLLLSNFFDELDENFLVIFQQFQRLEIPTVWLQSPLFDWQQV